MAHGIGNVIHPTAIVDDSVQLGSYNRIGANVTIAGFKGRAGGKIVIGDCNDIHENTRILIGPGGCEIGDWNVFHNSMLVMGDHGLTIGHNCWFGQNTILDGSGGLFIGNGVRVGMYSQLWTHVASGELIEGCQLFAERPTTIEDDVWLVGSCIVGSGLRIGKRSICLIGSLLTKDTAPHSVYGGAPAKHLEKLSFYKPVTLDQKFEMMWGWVQAYCAQPENSQLACARGGPQQITVEDRRDGARLEFVPSMVTTDVAERTTVFDLASKQYTKRLTQLERSFYRFIYNHKARFVPRGEQS